MKKRDVQTLINSKHFVQSVQLKSFGGIERLVIGNNAMVVKSWEWAADQIKDLEVIKEFKGGTLTDEQIAGIEPLPEEKV